jgi:hypothetical protein
MGKSEKIFCRMKIPILSFEYFKKGKNTKTVYIACMLNKKKILTVLSLTQVRRSKTFIGNGFTCFKGSTYCLVNVTGPITLVHKRLCGHKLQYIYQLYSAMFSG